MSLMQQLDGLKTSTFYFTASTAEIFKLNLTKFIGALAAAHDRAKKATPPVPGGNPRNSNSSVTSSVNLNSTFRNEEKLNNPNPFPPVTKVERKVCGGGLESLQSQITQLTSQSECTSN